jgi:hypothetical protein
MWHLFVRSAWAQLANVVAGTTVEYAALACVRLVSAGTASLSGGGQGR